MFRAVGVTIPTGSDPVELTVPVPAVNKPCAVSIKTYDAAINVGDSPSTCVWRINPTTTETTGPDTADARTFNLSIEPGDKIWATNDGDSPAVVRMVLFAGR